MDFRQPDDARPERRRSWGGLVMRLHAVFISGLAAAFAFSAEVAAQPAPPPDYGSPITLDQAKEVASAAQAEANRNGWRIAIAVVDPGGYLIYFERTDGSPQASALFAEAESR